MAGKLEGKVAIITGASSGIGEATAIALASVGARVLERQRCRQRQITMLKALVFNSNRVTFCTDAHFTPAMPAAGYAYAIMPQMIVQSLERRISVNAQGHSFESVRKS